MSEKNYDVFLSCKSEDYSKAEPIYHWLVANGHSTFFAPISLKVSKIHGEPVVFGDEIDDALDEADNMIVFTSNAEYVKKGYVKDEWRTYVEEQRTGRKTGMLITILDEVRIEELPIRLRSVQSFDLSNYKDGVLRFLGDTINTEKTLDDQEEQLAKEMTFTVGGVSFKMIRVEGGSFMMGSPYSDTDALDDEKPQHRVTLSDYYIGETQVTQALWKAVMGDNPSRSGKGMYADTCPVETVSWEDCQEFIKQLNKKTGKTFRLPTEAEWEYAARGGRNSQGFKYAGSNDIDKVAWCDHECCRTRPVKKKSANELGLFDMSGNVWEWCQDWKGDYNGSAQTNPSGPSSGSYRVLRGGSWGFRASHCRVASRFFLLPDWRDINYGFRLALVP